MTTFQIGDAQDDTVQYNVYVNHTLLCQGARLKIAKSLKFLLGFLRYILKCPVQLH